MADRKKKIKREIPLRAPGESVNPQSTRPSSLLFNEVLRLEQEASLTEPEIDNFLDVQNLNILDVQNDQNSDAQTSKNLDIQTSNIRASKTKQLGHPNNQILDAQNQKLWTSKQPTTGHPEKITLDVWTSKKKIRTSKTKEALDVQTPKEKILDVQKPSKVKYERNRSTDRLSLRPNPEILKRIKKFCIDKAIGLTEFFELAAVKFMDLDVQTNETLDVWTPLDDRRLKMMFKSRPFIINLYLRYNLIFNEFAAGKKGKWSAKWTARDDETGARYNDVSPVIIELGILQTQLNKGFGESRIQTFKYYTDEIEKVLMSGVSDETLGHILEYHRKMWAGQTGREIDLSFLNEEK